MLPMVPMHQQSQATIFHPFLGLHRTEYNQGSFHEDSQSTHQRLVSAHKGSTTISSASTYYCLISDRGMSSTKVTSTIVASYVSTPSTSREA